MAPPSRRSSVRREWGRTTWVQDWLTLAPVLVLGAALRLWLAHRNSGLTMDSPLYVNMADSLAHGRRAIGFAHHGYSALIALLGWMVPGRELPGRVLSWLAGMALVPLVYFLVRRTVPRLWAGFAAALVAAHPLLAVYSGPVMTETTYLAILFAALLLIDRQRFLAGGIGLGLGYAVRAEALVAAVGAVALGRGGRRGVLLMVAGLALVVAPYVAFMSVERGELTFTPKVALVRPPDEHPRDAEWRVGDAGHTTEPPRTLIERIGWAAPGVARSYLPRLATHLRRLLEVWPWPLMVPSVIGLALRVGPEAGSLLPLLVLPLLALGPDMRFSLFFVPALAVYAAAAGAWGAARWPRAQRIVSGGAMAAAVVGLAWCWNGPPGQLAQRFDDGPMPQMRAAGDWLRVHGRPGATVMDRKAYVPFYAGMRHVQLPDDDYDTVVEYARKSGVDYLVLEEYVVEGFRRQFLPLIGDPAFRAAEPRLRTIYHVREGPHTGVAVMEVEPDSTAPERDGQ
jgi:hypothetical protein